MKDSTKELLTYIKLIVTHSALKTTNLTMRCLLLALGGAEFFTEKPFYQQISLDGRPAASSSKKRRGIQRKAVNRFSKLELHGFIEKHKRGDRFLYSLTEKGALRLLKESIRCAPKLKEAQCIFVSYDIPEEYRSARDLFRQFLSESGLRLFHESLFFSNHDIEVQLKHFIETHNLHPWVKVIRGIDII